MIKGVYIHIPFCSYKCPYCDFTSVVVGDSSIYSRYVDLLKKELLLYSDKKFSISSIYFGGGTPSILPAGYITGLIEHIAKNFPVAEDPEITVEVNPETYRQADFRMLKEGGVNRISVGAQSFDRQELQKLGRQHSPEDTLKTVDSAFKAGIENISIDIIYGIEGQTVSSVEKTLITAVSLPVKHVSAYMLTAYEDTPLGQEVEEGRYRLAEERTVLEMFKSIDELLENSGFYRYELSNWAQKGYQCRHNLLYWERKEFLGVGLSAWSFVNRCRFGNTKNLNEYVKAVSQGIKPVAFQERIDEQEERKEQIFLGLRLKKGVELKLLEGREKEIEAFIDEGLGYIEEDRFVLTPEGIMVSNSISAALI
ncbi:radical SAM family heme chaperone HemW [Persephonella sp.]